MSAFKGANMSCDRRGFWEIVILSLSMTVVSALLASAPILAAPRGTTPEAGPTKEGALATVEAMARAMRENDAEGIARLLSDDWAVISARGGVGEGKSIFPDGIKSGQLTRTAFEVSEPRVRLYGDVALVTTKVRTAGTFVGKPFDVRERETDALRWQDGTWKIVLTHETFETPREADAH
jgi:ketosteroid isomerase-like protein